MSDIVIKAENIGKKYTIGHQSQRGGYTSLRDVWMQNARTLWNKTKDLAAGKAIIQGDTMEEVWALKDLSFDIHCGEAVGIIGRNGAGKSTLLKVLSRITEPSAGRVIIKGRVASLLEVGTGFHPELSGRENIFLNGTILGMSRKEIKQKFDEIVAFAEIEKYLDTPVKRYSSGMYVRLAFAVAAHLEPEILLVDEVLAVGDLVFQEKCLGKMDKVAKEGRTVLLVSHNMAVIQSLAKRTMLFKRGQLSFAGNTDDAIKEYVASNKYLTKMPLACRTDRFGTSPGTLRDIRLKINLEEVDKVVIAGMPLEIELDYILDPKSKPDFFIAFYDMFERRVIHLNTIMSGFSGKNRPPRGTVKCVIPKLTLAPGSYGIAVAIDCQGETLDRIEHAVDITVTMGDFFGTGQTKGSDWGMCLVEHSWQIL
jgi:lipopolysaccharide transport system ATP-binding protein